MATMVVQDRPGLDETVNLPNEWQARRTGEDRHAYTFTEEKNSWWHTSIESTLCSRDEHVPKATVELFEATARNIIKSHPSGHMVFVEQSNHLGQKRWLPKYY